MLVIVSDGFTLGFAEIVEPSTTSVFLQIIRAHFFSKYMKHRFLNNLSDNHVLFIDK